MARKKKLNPIATALTIAGLGVTGFLLWKFVIKPYRAKKLQETKGTILDSVIDTNYTEITPDQENVA